MESVPSFQADIKLILTKGESMDGKPQNEYKLKSDSLNRYYFRTKVFAYVNDTAVFINGEKIERFLGFSRCYTDGNFLVFHSPNANVNGVGEATVIGAVLGGVVGAVVGAAIDAEKNEPYPYWGLFVYSVRTGNVRNMTEEYLYARLQDYPKLRREHSKGNYAEDEESLIRFMQLINDKIAEE